MPLPCQCYEDSDGTTKKPTSMKRWSGYDCLGCIAFLLKGEQHHFTGKLLWNDVCLTNEPPHPAKARPYHGKGNALPKDDKELLTIMSPT